MKIDQYGRAYRTEEELCDLLYTNPLLDLHAVQVENPDKFNKSIKEMFYEFEPLTKYRPLDISVEEFDEKNQANWLMPDEIKQFDIAKWLLDQCQTDEELQRVGHELILYQERGLFDLLRFMKYFVDTMRQHNVVWGVGRGSSVASYVLFLIGVHKINSLYFDLAIEEFIK
jgi:DNA polymerase III alpha subunit